MTPTVPEKRQKFRAIWWWIRVNIIWGEKALFIPHPTFVKKGARNWKEQDSKWCIRTQNNIIYAKFLFPTLPWRLLHLHWTLESSSWAGEGKGDKGSSWSVYQISLTDFEIFWKRLWKVTINLIYSIKIYFLWHQLAGTYLVRISSNK